MSLKNKFFSLFTVILSVVIFSTFVVAQETKKEAPKKADKHAKGERVFGKGDFAGKGFGGRHGAKGMRGRMAPGAFGRMGGIDLTDAQKEQIKSIKESNKPNQATIDEARTLMQAKRSGTLSADQTDRMKALWTERQNHAKSVHEQIQNVFTAEQKAQIEQRKQDMKQRMQERMKNRKERVGPATRVKPISE